MGLFIPIAMGVATIAQSIARGIQSRRNTNRTIQAQKAEAEKAYAIQQAGINAQNLYNSPAEQMKRFEEAKLNKNLIYTQGNPGNQNSFARYEATRPDYSGNTNYFEPGNALNAYMSAKALDAQTQNYQTQGEILKTEAGLQAVKLKYADDMARIAYNTEYNQSQMAQMKKVFQDVEFGTFFKEIPTGQYDKYNQPIVRYEFADENASQDFAKYVLAKFSKDYQDLQNATTEGRKKLLDEKIKQNLYDLQNSGLPWMNTIIGFLRIFAGAL